jgi:hypothetical protein
MTKHSVDQLGKHIANQLRDDVDPSIEQRLREIRKHALASARVHVASEQLAEAEGPSSSSKGSMFGSWGAGLIIVLILFGAMVYSVTEQQAEPMEPYTSPEMVENADTPAGQEAPSEAIDEDTK